MKMWLKILLVVLALLVGTLGGWSAIREEPLLTGGWSAIGIEPEALEFDPDGGWSSVRDVTPDGGWSSVHDITPDGGWSAI
jgi:hypothetical protein